MEIRARYVLMGLFTLAAIAAGFAFVYWLQTKGSLGKQTTYEVRFKSTVSGLLTGSAVLFNGIRVGEVTALHIVPDDPRLVDATISVAANTPVRTDTLVSLEFQGLTGYAVVTLTGGSPSALSVTAPAGQLPRLEANDAAGQSMSEAARQVLGRLDKILSDNQNDIHSMISNLNSFSEALGRNSGKVDSVIAGLERMTGGGGKEAGTFYGLSALPPSQEPGGPLGKQLAVADPTALFAYDSQKILSQPEAGQLEGLGAGKWSDTLPKLIQARLVQSFENTGALGEVSRPIDNGTADYQLLTEIQRFQIVQGPEPVAEAEIRAKLVTSDGHIAAARIFRAKEPVKSLDDAEAAHALDGAFKTIEAELLAWTRSIITEPAGQNTAQEKPAQAAKKR